MSSRSMFSASPFHSQGRSLGLVPMTPPRSLGQDWLDIVGDVGGPIGDILEDVTGLLSDLDPLIAKLPVGVAGPFTKRRDACLEKSDAEKYMCLYSLFQDVKRAVRDQEQAAPSTPTTPTPTPPKKEDGFPYVPVAIGGVAVAALLYAIFKGGG